MGVYLNPGNEKFFQCINSEIYIDKTGLIHYCNRVLNSLQKYICMSRPRRFGKSVTADMLAAYYSRGCDSRELFEGYEISKDESSQKYLNQYNVLFLNMQEFLSRTNSMEDMLALLKNRVIRELSQEYPQVDYYDKHDLIGCMQDLYSEVRIPFILIIDEWDCIFREYKSETDAQKMYLDFLRDLLKDKGYISLCYMTGILPIKKYGTHSALNMFDEFSMTFQGALAKYVGFTEDEVRGLCTRYNMDFEEVKKWYDGYYLEDAGSIYNPRSVVSAMRFGKFQYYWNQTETFEALRSYIDMNFEGLRDAVIEMINGKEGVAVNIHSFTNDMVTFHSRDDVLTLLIHLGYLGYRSDESEVFIPNYEILNEYINSISNSDWGEVTEALRNSKEALKAVWRGDEAFVAKAVQNAHYESSYLQYNDENALSYTISLAFYVARNYYTVIKEFPSGKGRTDIVYIPRKEYPDKPALLIELKWNKTAESAVAQIKDKCYPKALEEYTGNLLLVGINYNEETKEHSCRIEQYTK
ncbi:MAG: ATP-binding protein [Lachnospiraceae bacterium]